MLKRAYTLLDIKAADDESRTIEGTATTPTPDRMGDIIESEGAEFKLPLPLLFQHNSREPIGHVIDAKVSKKGITIKAQVAAAGITAEIDKAWALIKAGLVRGLSIGFRALDVEDIPNSWAVRVKKWEWLELSAVTIPANGDATVHRIKSIDREVRAAMGLRDDPVVRATAGASAQPNPKAKRETMAKKTLGEQIAAFEATRAARMAARDEIMDASSEKGETLTAEQKEAYDGLTAEIKAIDEHLVRLRDLEAERAKTARPVDTVPAPKAAADSREPFGTVQVRAAVKRPPGIGMARYVKCLAISQKQHVSALDVAQALFKHDPEVVETIKAVVVAGSTVSGNWAANLVGEETSIFADFVAFLRPRTIVGRFGDGGIPSLRSVPFRVALVSEIAGGAGYWVGEGKGKPLTSFDYARTTLTPLKVANIAVLTEEVIRDSSPAAEGLVRDGLVAALRERLDIDFIDPAKAAVAGISPASILNGIVGIPSSGATEDDVRTDIKAVLGQFIAGKNAPTTGVWIMKETTALALSMMVNALGQPAFPGITQTGGTLNGMPVITSEYVPGETAGDVVALVNAGDIYFADEGGFDIALSREASLEMDSAPTQSSVATVTPSQVVSMFQTNSVAFRAERTVNWARRRAVSAAYLTGVNWGA